jgi:transcriptional regulator GlxA family with amidase domain
MPPIAPEPHVVAVVALEEAVAFDLSTPVQVFGSTPPGAYELRVCGLRAGVPVTTAGGLFALVPDHGLEALAAAGTVIVPGIDHVAAPQPAPLLEALRTAAGRGARIVSICTGAFVLGQAGLLDGRRVATHWRHADELAAACPLARVERDVLYVDEGQLLTSAGVAAGIDLCLHLLRRDLGAEAANRVARRVVVAPHRPGGQAQFAERPLPAEDDRGLAATRAWMLERLDAPLTVADMAAHACCSERTFARRFRSETGTTPLQWLLGQRVLAARRLLEATDLPVELVAGRCGFGTATGLRDHFRRACRTTPTAYRSAFRVAR